jgi:putative phosphoribosyl transferase
VPHFFRDRHDAGRQLAALLTDYAGHAGVIVLGLPRGGVPVAAEIARALGAPLDIFTVRKLGVPGNEELAMGAIATGGVCVMNEEYLAHFRITPAEIARIRATEERELERRERLFRGDRPPLDARGSTVIIVDDGLATGATMRAAVEALRRQHPLRIIAAVPVASPEACQAVSDVVDECVCLTRPSYLGGVGAWYDDFSQTEDSEVRQLLDAAMRELPETVRESAVRARHPASLSNGKAFTPNMNASA